MCMAVDSDGGFGQRLKQRRERAALTLSDVTDRTKIQAEYLEALESGQVERLPSPFFAKSFLRQYTAALGIRGAEASELEVALEHMLDGQSGQWEPSILSGRRAKSGGTLRLALNRLLKMSGGLFQNNAQVITALALVALGTAGWWLLADQDTAGAPVATATAEPAVPAPQMQPPRMQLAPSRESDPARVAPADSAAPASPEPARSGGNPFQRPGLMQVDVTALGLVWLRWQADSSSAKEVTLEAGERVRFAAGEASYLTTGNAMNTSLRINGAEQDLRGSGSVRHYRITRDGIAIVPPGSF